MGDKGLKNVWLFLRLIVEPGWAPIAVLVSYLLMTSTDFAFRHDYVFHFAGGAAITYFALRATALVPSLSARIGARSRPAFAFAFAVVMAVVWEVAEYAQDARRGTDFHGGMGETAKDLVIGIVGAGVAALIAWRAGRVRAGSPVP